MSGAVPPVNPVWLHGMGRNPLSFISTILYVLPYFLLENAGMIIPFYVSRDSSVGIATGYGLDDPGIDSLWGAKFSAPVQTGHVAHNVYRVSFPGVKRLEPGVDQPPPPRAEVKERVEL